MVGGSRFWTRPAGPNLMNEPTDIAVSCSCGKVRGTIRDVTPRSCNHVVCLCDDCQAYIGFLGNAGILDANGGTEIVQVGHNQVNINEGREHVACIRLSDKGMFRWYASCCNTPLANTLGPKSVFAGVVSACLRTPANGARIEHVIGPIKERVQGKFGKGELPPDTRQTVSASMILWTARNLARWWWKGANNPSTFFTDGRPCVPPRVLGAEERKALC